MIRKKFQILQYDIIGFSHILFVCFIIQCLDIVQKGIHIRQQPCIAFLWRIPAGINRDIVSLILQLSAQLFQIIDILRHDLSPGKRYTPAAFLIEMRVLVYDGHQLLNAVLLSDDFTVVVKAVIQTVCTEHTFICIRMCCTILLNRNGSVTASLTAISAATAFFPVKHQLRCIPLTFRVVAPPAVQQTALKEYRCTDTVSVMHRIFLNIDYGRLFHSFSPAS